MKNYSIEDIVSCLFSMLNCNSLPEIIEKRKLRDNELKLYIKLVNNKAKRLGIELNLSPQINELSSLLENNSTYFTCAPIKSGGYNIMLKKGVTSYELNEIVGEKLIAEEKKCFFDVYIKEEIISKICENKMNNQAKCSCNDCDSNTPLLFLETSNHQDTTMIHYACLKCCDLFGMLPKSCLDTSYLIGYENELNNSLKEMQSYDCVDFLANELMELQQNGKLTPKEIVEVLKSKYEITSKKLIKK